MRANSFDMPYEELLRTALTYAIADARRAGHRPPGAPIRARPLEMRYRDLRYRSPLAALDREMETMARLVVQHRRATTPAHQARDARPGWARRWPPWTAPGRNRPDAVPAVAGSGRCGAAAPR